MPDRHSTSRSGPYDGQIGEVAYDHSAPAPRPVDRCLSCGRFVGRYPVGFCCDTHCKNCICSNCPGVDGPGVYVICEEADRAA